MKKAKKDDWVVIENTVLEANRRAENLPDDTRAVPLKMWVKGRLVDEAAEIGDRVEVVTMTERRVSGELVEIAPTYTHSFGDFVPEILEIGRRLQRFRTDGGV